MGQIDDIVVGERDFAIYDTLNEVLLKAREHVDLALYASNYVRLEAHTKMASRAIRCALEIYGDWILEMLKEKEKKGEKV